MSIENNIPNIQMKGDQTRLQRLGSFIVKPHSSITEVGDRRTATLAAILSIAVTLTITTGLIATVNSTDPSAFNLFAFIICLLSAILGYLYSRTQYFMIGSILIVISLSISGIVLTVTGSGESVYSSIYTSIPLSLLIAAALLPLKGLVPITIIDIVAISILPLFFTDINPNQLFTAVGPLSAFSVVLILTTVFRNRIENERLEEVNSINEELHELSTSLEQQVKDRTRDLEISAEVSRRLSTILDQDQLVREVVDQLRTAFGYYHAHIYLYDDIKQYLVMVGGTGDVGRTLLNSGHKLEKGQGLVGQAAENNQVVLIPDVTWAEGWLPNPLLPETKAEIAVPIAIGEDVLGVLDVQHDVSGGLTKKDAELIQTIANQVAIAVSNARAYARSQRQAIREAQITTINKRIQSAATIEDVLHTAIIELGQTLGAQTASVDIKANPKSVVQLNDR